MPIFFTDENVAKLFGAEAAEDEPEDRFRQYFFYNQTYENLISQLPLRILVGHKGVGKSALLKRAYLSDQLWTKGSTAGINWENVSKRILPQIIFKGHVLRNEPLCIKGMYFICPAPVHERIMTRLGNDLRTYHPQSGAVTFRWYDLAPPSNPGERRGLAFTGQMTTTVDQVALAFTSPKNLPAAGVYEAAIRAELEPKKEKK